MYSGDTTRARATNCKHTKQQTSHCEPRWPLATPHALSRAPGPPPPAGGGRGRREKPQRGASHFY
jgi:hypothetical protein